MEVIVNRHKTLHTCSHCNPFHVSIELDHQRAGRRKFRTSSTDLCTAQTSSYEPVDKCIASGIRSTECPNVAW